MTQREIFGTLFPSRRDRAVDGFRECGSRQFIRRRSTCWTRRNDATATHRRWHRHQRSFDARSGLLDRLGSARRRQLQCLHAQPRSCCAIAATPGLPRGLSACPICHSRRLSDRHSEPALGTQIERTTGADLVEPVCAEARKKGLPYSCWVRTISRSMRRRGVCRSYFRDCSRGLLCARPELRSLFQRSRRGDRTHSRIRRQTLLRRAGRAASGIFCGALSRRAQRNRLALHRRRARLHRGYAEPRTVHHARKPDSNGHGECCAIRGGSGRAMHVAWRSFPGWWRAPFRKSSTHA